MKQFLAFKGGALIYAQHKVFTAAETAAAPEDLTDGAIALYAVGNGDKLILIDGATDFADVKKFVVARGTTKNPIISDEIERKSLSIEKNAAVTAVAKAVTLAFPTNLAAGTTVTVQVSDTSSPIMSEWKWRNYEYTTIAANESSATIGAGILAKVNADSKAIVTQSGMILTAKTAGNKGFDVTILDAPGATATVTAQPVRAQGAIATLQDLQLECHGYQGGSRRGDGQLGDKVDYNLIDTAAANHVVYNLSWTGTANRLGVPVDAATARFKRLYVAIPTGATAITVLDTMLVVSAQEEVAANAEEMGS